MGFIRWGLLLLLWWSRTVLVHYLVWFCKMGLYLQSLQSQIHSQDPWMGCANSSYTNDYNLFYHNIYTDIPECSALILRFILWHITPDSIVCSGQVTLKFSVFLYSEPSFLYIDCLFGLFTEDSIALSLDEEAFSFVTDKRKWSWEIKTNEEERDGKTAVIVAPLKIGKVKWVFGWLLFLYNHFVHIAFFVWRPTVL